MCLFSKRGKSHAIRVMGNRRCSKLHPKSVLCRATSFDSPLLVYWEKIKSACDFIHDVSTVHPLPIIFFGDQFGHFTIEGEDVISIGNALMFKAREQTVRVISQLRDRLNWFLGYKISHPGVVDWRENNDEIRVLK